MTYFYLGSNSSHTWEGSLLTCQVVSFRGINPFLPKYSCSYSEIGISCLTSDGKGLRCVSSALGGTPSPVTYDYGNVEDGVCNDIDMTLQMEVSISVYYNDLMSMFFV